MHHTTKKVELDNQIVFTIKTELTQEFKKQTLNDL